MRIVRPPVGRPIAQRLVVAANALQIRNRRVIRGGKSDHVSDADAQRLTAAGCRVDTLEGASHFLHVDRPEELLDRIAQGLA